MRPGGGKAKGAAFERKVCQELSRWVSRGKADDLFWRSAMSGGRATVARKKDKKLVRQAGDITATAPEGAALTDTFYLECKFLKDLAFDSFALRGIGILAAIWRVATVEAEAHGRVPFLIAKQNNMPTIAVMPFNLIFAKYAWSRSPIICSVMNPNVSVLDFEAMMACRFQPIAKDQLL